MNTLKKYFNKINLLLTSALFAGTQINGTTDFSQQTNVSVGWKIPSLADIISFMIRTFFVIAGLAALLYLLLGAFAWVTSSGDKENVKKAQDKIQAAIVGLIIIVGVLAIIITLEQFVFNRNLCLGLSCPLNIPSLIQTQGQ